MYLLHSCPKFFKEDLAKALVLRGINKLDSSNTDPEINVLRQQGVFLQPLHALYKRLSPAHKRTLVSIVSDASSQTSTSAEWATLCRQNAQFVDNHLIPYFIVAFLAHIQRNVRSIHSATVYSMLLLKQVTLASWLRSVSVLVLVIVASLLMSCRLST